jgi:hypothetical protein
MRRNYKNTEADFPQQEFRQAELLRNLPSLSGCKISRKRISEQCRENHGHQISFYDNNNHY